MTSRPIRNGSQSLPQQTSFNEKKNEEKITASKQLSDLGQRKYHHDPQKMVRKLLLFNALLSIAVIVFFYFLLFGFSADTVRLFFPSILANLVTVLFIYILGEIFLQSMDKYRIQIDELEHIERIVEEKIEEKLEPIIIEVAVSSTTLTNLERQLKKQEKEFASIKKMLEVGMTKLEEENVALRKRAEAIEDYLTLPRSA